MKIFTSRDLNSKRKEIKFLAKKEGCQINFCSSDRTVDLETVLISKEEYTNLIERIKKL